MISLTNHDTVMISQETNSLWELLFVETAELIFLTWNKIRKAGTTTKDTFIVQYFG